MSEPNQEKPAIEKPDGYWTPNEPQTAVLAKLIRSRQMTSKDVAELLGCHQSNVSHVLNGKQKLTADQIDVLAKFFDVPHGMFFGMQKTNKAVNKAAKLDKTEDEN